jgi:hypothetical protein
VNNASLVQVADTGDELGEQLTRRAVLQIAVVEDVVEQLTARRILEDDADVALSLNHLMQANNVRVVEPAQDVDLAVDLGQAVRVTAQGLSPYELDGNLDAAVALPAHLDLAELALTKRLTQDVVTKLGPLGRALALRVVLSALASAAAAVVNALAAHQAEAGYRGQVGSGAHRRPLLLARLFAGDVVLGVGDTYPVDDGALFAGQAGAHGGLTDGGCRAAMPGLRAARAALCPPTRGALGVGGAVGGGPRRGRGTASRRLAVAVAHGVGRAGRGASRAGGLLVVLLAMRLRSDSSRHALAKSAGAGSKRSWAGPVGSVAAVRPWGGGQCTGKLLPQKARRRVCSGWTGDCVRLWRAAGGVQCCNGEHSMAVGGGRGLAGGAARVVWWSSWQALSRGAADGCGWRLADG